MVRSRCKDVREGEGGGEVCRCMRSKSVSHR